MPNKIHKQASKESLWALITTILYAIGWCVFAYLPTSNKGLLGFPLWFELSCIYLPILFIFVGHWVIKRVYKDINLDTNLTTDK